MGKYIGANEYYKEGKKINITYFIPEATHELKNIGEIATELRKQLGFTSITNLSNTSINITNAGKKTDFKIQRPLNNSELEELAIELTK